MTLTVPSDAGILRIVHLSQCQRPFRMHTVSKGKAYLGLMEQAGLDFKDSSGVKVFLQRMKGKKRFRFPCVCILCP